VLAAAWLSISRAAVGCRTEEREPPDLRVERRRGREIGCCQMLGRRRGRYRAMPALPDRRVERRGREIGRLLS
jgi:hypothetical protein